jgi:hypothetical protein
MASFEELERKFLIEKLQLEESEVFEARFNLLGAFNVLYKIDERLRKEEEAKKELERRSND